jgi:uncharacterized LabA/DUF88 family protein
MSKPDKGPQFEFSPYNSETEGMIYCNRPLLMNVAVGKRPMDTVNNLLYEDKRGFFFSYKPHTEERKQQSVIKRMADWYYYTILQATARPTIPEKETEILIGVQTFKVEVSYLEAQKKFYWSIHRYPNRIKESGYFTTQSGTDLIEVVHSFELIKEEEEALLDLIFNAFYERRPNT